MKTWYGTPPAISMRFSFDSACSRAYLAEFFLPVLVLIPAWDTSWSLDSLHGCYDKTITNAFPRIQLNKPTNKRITRVQLNTYTLISEIITYYKIVHSKGSNHNCECEINCTSVVSLNTTGIPSGVYVGMYIYMYSILNINMQLLRSTDT